MSRTCARCGGPETAHLEPDETWPDGVCVCGMPDGPCGCSGFDPIQGEAVAVEPEGVCAECRDPGACCRAFTFSARFPVAATRDEVRRALRDMKYPHFEPLGRITFERLASGDVVAKWIVGCSALDERGRCSVYVTRPACCRGFEPKSDVLCVEFDGPWEKYLSFDETKGERT